MLAPPAAHQGATECASTASCGPGATSPAFSASGRACCSSAAIILPGSSLNNPCVEQWLNQTTTLYGTLTSPNHSAATLKDTLWSCLLDVVIHHLFVNKGPAYCVPYEHLTNFYGKVGFIVTPPELLPEFIAGRLAGYVQRVG